MEMNNIKLELTIDEINIILNALSVQPYREVVEIISKIQKTGNEQLKKD